MAHSNKLQICQIVFVALIYVNFGSAFTADDVYFAIDWTGQRGEDFIPPPPSLASDDLVDPNRDTNSKGIFITSAENEKYFCELPDEDKIGRGDDAENYDGPNEESLLQPLMQQQTCTMRLEMYWSYELCHGKHLRQFHEEKDQKRTKLQQYYLGQSRPKNRAPAKEEIEDTQERPKQDTAKIPTKKVEGIEIPYYAVQFEDGTTCDLTGNPRRASIQYVCHTEGNGELYEIKEVSTCEYEALVLTRLLCSHPSYQQKKSPVSKISCQAVDGAPKKPQVLQEFEREQEDRESIFGSGIKVTFHSSVPKPSPVETPPPPATEDKPDKALSPARDAMIRQQRNAGLKSPDTNIIRDFFMGDFCLIGGAGWWKYEICYHKKVWQFHEDRRQNSRVEILLGKWDKDVHLNWLRDHPTKRPKTDPEARKVISHFYSSGDLCDLTKKPRQVELKMKCAEGASVNSLAIYLLEPETCVYTLVAESPFFCTVFKHMDENGLLSDEALAAIP